MALSNTTSSTGRRPRRLRTVRASKNTLSEVERLALAALRPPPHLRLSEWVKKHLHLPESVSALPGPVRLWPYQREIADAIGDPTVERVTLVKPVRVGFSMLLTGAVAAFVANDPSPILVLQPTESDARDKGGERLEPTFSASPVVAGLLEGGDDERGDVVDPEERGELGTGAAGPRLQTVADRSGEPQEGFRLS